MTINQPPFRSYFIRFKYNNIYNLQQRIQQFILDFSDFTQNTKGAWILIKRGIYTYIAFEDILFIKADDHYIEVHCCKNKTYIAKSQIAKFYEKYLSINENFFQLSRSYIVNLDKAYKIINNQLLLEEEKRLSIPKSKKSELLKAIGVKL